MGKFNENILMELQVDFNRSSVWHRNFIVIASENSDEKLNEPAPWS